MREENPLVLIPGSATEANRKVCYFSRYTWARRAVQLSVFCTVALSQIRTRPRVRRYCMGRVSYLIHVYATLCFNYFRWHRRMFSYGRVLELLICNGMSPEIQEWSHKSRSRINNLYLLTRAIAWWLSLVYILLTRRDGQAELTWAVDYIPEWRERDSNPRTVTHPSTDRPGRTTTALIEINARHRYAKPLHELYKSALIDWLIDIANQKPVSQRNGRLFSNGPSIALKMKTFYVCLTVLIFVRMHFFFNATTTWWIKMYI